MNFYKSLYLLKKRGNGSPLHKKRDSSHSFGMTNNAVISTEGRNLFYQGPLGYPELLRSYKSFNFLKGFTLLEVIIGCALFVVIFMPLFGLYSVQGIGQQKLIRDYAVAINIAENALNLIENEIEKGDISDFPEEDITKVLFGNPQAKAAVLQLLGEGKSESAKYMPGFKVLLTVKKSTTGCYNLRLKFIWGSTDAQGNLKEEHRFVLSTLKSRL